MALKRQRDTCRRCDQGPKWIKARGLCESCWMHVKGSGSLELWPRLDEMRQRKGFDGWCHCFAPIPQSIGLFAGAVQCLKCGKKLPDDR